MGAREQLVGHLVEVRVGERVLTLGEVTLSTRALEEAEVLRLYVLFVMTFCNIITIIDTIICHDNIINHIAVPGAYCARDNQLYCRTWCNMIVIYVAT